ncbi:MAG: co-chaperone GroES, partial [Oscillospiraceae bacterium]
MNIKPLFDKVVLKQPEKSETTKSGIILSASAQEKPEFLEVYAAGEGAIIDGVKQPMLVKAGD